MEFLNKPEKIHKASETVIITNLPVLLSVGVFESVWESKSVAKFKFSLYATSAILSGPTVACNCLQ